jgi:hypothetical protein
VPANVLTFRAQAQVTPTRDIVLRIDSPLDVSENGSARLWPIISGIRRLKRCAFRSRKHHLVPSFKLGALLFNCYLDAVDHKLSSQLHVLVMKHRKEFDQKTKKTNQTTKEKT